MSSNSISQSLGISGGTQEIIERSQSVSKEVLSILRKQDEILSKAETESDIREIRNNLKRLISASEEAVEELLVLAKDTEHPRAYEVFGGLVAHTVEANKTLLGLHDKITQLRSIKEPGITEQNATSITNNQIVVRSTDDLLSTLKKMKENNNGN